MNESVNPEETVVPASGARETAKPRLGIRPPNLPREIWALVILGALIRLWCLPRYGLWLDEVYVYNDSMRPFSRFFYGTVHGLHFLAVKLSLSICDAEFFLRLPSALFGILSIPLGFATARRLFNRLTATHFAFFLAFAPYLMNYSIDANYYSHMMFWTLASLYFFARLQSTKALWNLIPLALASIAAVFVHPFSGLHAAALGLATAIEVLSSAEYLARIPGLRRLSKTPEVRVAVFVLLGLSVCGMFLVFFSESFAVRRFESLYNSLLERLAPGVSLYNIEFSFAFFFDYFRKIGAGVYCADTLFIEIGVIAFFAAFIGGSAISSRFGRINLVLLLFPFVLSFTIIFNLDSTHFFHVRYLSYLVPLYWLGVSVLTAEGWNRLIRPGDSPTSRQSALSLLAPLALSVFFFPQYAYFVTVEARTWDDFMPAVAAEAEGGDLLVCTNSAELVLAKYYARKYGLPSSIVRKLDYTQRRSKFAEAELKDLCFRNRRLWFVFGWSEMASEEAQEWARKRLKMVKAARSFFSPGYNVTLYEWKTGGRYILPPLTLRYAPPPEKESASPAFEETFIFEDSMDYEARITADGSRPGVSLAATLDGIELKLSPGTDSLQAPCVTGTISVESGERTLRIEAGGGEFAVQTIEIVPRYPNGAITIPAWAAFRLFPGDFIATPREGGDYLLYMDRKSFASYAFGVGEEGEYAIECEARHDRPGPVIIELRLDGRSLGILLYDKEDASWESKTMPAAIGAGNHTLSAHLLSETRETQSVADLAREGYVRRFRIRKLQDGETSPDQRYVSPDEEPIALPLINEDGSGIHSSMQLATEPGVSAAVVYDESLGRKALAVEMQQSADFFLLASPIIKMKDTTAAYFSGEARTNDLRNHSANLMTVFMDKNLKVIGKPRWVNWTGITGTTEWTRFVSFSPAIEDCAYYQMIFRVYPNGKKPSPRPGTAFFAGFQVEKR